MQGYAHLMTGIASGGLIFGTPTGIICAGIGALLPDIDNPRSILGKKVPLISLLCGKHRGWTHSLLGAMIFSLPLILFTDTAGYALLTGYLTHLALDFLNPAGIKFFWPFGRHRSIIGIPSSSILWNAVITIVTVLTAFGW